MYTGSIKSHRDILKKNKKIALEPVALERLIRVHLPPMYTGLFKDAPVDFLD
jgi:hypothetical protein